MDVLGAGCAEISNWARAILAVKPVSDDMQVFKFVAAKRGRRIDGKWTGIFERYYVHSRIPGVIRWEEANAAQIALATASKQKTVDLCLALKQVPIVNAELKTTVVDKIRNVCKDGRSLAEDALNELIVTGKALNVRIPNPAKGRGFSGVVQACSTTI